MDRLLNNSAQSEISNRVKGMPRALFVDDWQSEAKFQRQTLYNEDIKP